MKITAILTTFFIVSTNLFAQHETDERVIGFKYVLKFNQNSPNVTLTNTNLFDPLNANYKGIMGTPYSNSICDTLGNLLFYYDGATVYEANGQIMSGGNLHVYNFSSYYVSSLIVPIEESNRRYYYLFETVPYEENWDFNNNRPKNCPVIYSNCADFYDQCRLQYHIIDMHANNGNGTVLNTHIFVADSVAPSVSGIKHQNNIDTWVSVLKSRTNIILNYKVNSCSISTPVKNDIPDFEYPDSPYWPYSPRLGLGFQLVYSTLGDIVAFTGTKKSENMQNTISKKLFIAPFNNSTGLFDFNALQSIPVTSAICNNLFSHNSKYLYYHDTDLFVPVWIFQYNIDTKTIFPFYYNSEKNFYSGIDYGENNDLLLLKLKRFPINAGLNPVGYLGKINNINHDFLPSHLIDSLNQPAFEQLKGPASLLYVARNNYIYNFYHPDYKKPDAFPVARSVSNTITSPACFNQPVTLKGKTNIPADSMYWLIKKTSDTNWQRVNSDTFDITLSPGTYTASLVSYKYCLPDSATQQFTIEDYPAVRLADDTLYTCESKPVELPANDTYSYYWYNENGETVSNQISATGKYNIVVQNSCGTGKDSLYLKNSLLEMTNLITANNDNRNDCMIATSNNKHETIQLSIYNSWGSCVFSDNNYHNNWCPGNELSNGVYYYEARYNNACSKKGWIEIVR